MQGKLFCNDMAAVSAVMAVTGSSVCNVNMRGPAIARAYHVILWNAMSACAYHVILWNAMNDAVCMCLSCDSVECNE